MEPSSSPTLPQSSSPAGETRPRRGPFAIEHFFSRPGRHPFDELKWERRQARISDEKGTVIFEQDDVEVPADWSMLATNVVASKYFYGELGTGEREYSVRQLVHRVARTHRRLGRWRTATSPRPRTPRPSTTSWPSCCVNQYGSFNSPVWFNVGLYQVYGLASAAARQLPLGAREPARSCARTRATSTRRLGLLHPVGRRHDGRHHAPGRLPRPCSSSTAPAPARTFEHAAQQPGEALRRRHALAGRSASCGCSTRSPRSSSPAARRAARPRCRASRSAIRTSWSSSTRKRERGEEGLGADRAGLRRLLQRRGLRLGDVPERQPLRARRPTTSCRPSRTTARGRRGR